jgi:uncharacterized protein YcbK (DUF882 family)
MSGDLRGRVACCHHTSAAQLSAEIIHVLEELEAATEREWAYISGMRCPACNLWVGGVQDSEHLYGFAVDIAATSARDRFDILQALIKMGVTRIGIGPTYLHAGIGQSHEQRQIWLYGDHR